MINPRICCRNLVCGYLRKIMKCHKCQKQRQRFCPPRRFQGQNESFFETSTLITILRDHSSCSSSTANVIWKVSDWCWRSNTKPFCHFYVMSKPTCDLFCTESCTGGRYRRIKHTIIHIPLPRVVADQEIAMKPCSDREICNLQPKSDQTNQGNGRDSVQTWLTGTPLTLHCGWWDVAASLQKPSKVQQPTRQVSGLVRCKPTPTCVEVGSAQGIQAPLELSPCDHKLVLFP